MFNQMKHFGKYTHNFQNLLSNEQMAKLDEENPQRYIRY